MIIHYVTGSRADFGLMKKCLEAIHASPKHDLHIVVTSQHLCSHYGDTVQDIENSDLNIIARIPVSLSGQGGQEMGVALADELRGFLELWSSTPPDLVLLLGDRGEMLAAALAGVHLGIHVAHIHGGERSGTLDESFRHAITKLSHIHFPATAAAAQRIQSLGEYPENIHVIGAPGLVGLQQGISAAPDVMRQLYGLPDNKPIALTVFHPVVQEAARAGEQVEAVISSVHEAGFAQVVLRPNSDAGGRAIDACIDHYADYEDICVLKHLERDAYCTLLASSDVMVGNSSSGIIESATFGVPCVNIGSRQNARERNTNVIDCASFDKAHIAAALNTAKTLPRVHENVYGTGRTDDVLVSVLDKLRLTSDMLQKTNAY